MVTDLDEPVNNSRLYFVNSVYYLANSNNKIVALIIIMFPMALLLH